MNENDVGYDEKELEWLSNNKDIVRALIASTPKQIEEVKEVTLGPIEMATKKLISSLKRKLYQIDEAEKKHNKEIKYYLGNKAEIEHNGSKLTDYEKDFLENVAPEKSRNFIEHREALKYKVERLTNEPQECFLPIGTIVAFKGPPDYVDSLALSDMRKSYPVEGSIGVVTRITSGNEEEFTLGVSMRKPYRDGWNEEWLPSDSRLPTFRADPSMLEVIGYGLLPNGEEYKGYSFIETHERRESKIVKESAEMVLLCDGHYWRFHDFGGTQGIEALQAYENLEEMSWIKGPLKKFNTEQNSNFIGVKY